MKIFVLTLVSFFLGLFYSTAQQAVGNFIYLDEFSEPMFYCEIDSSSCADASDGAISLTLFNENISSFEWSNGSTDSILTHLQPGVYDLTIQTEFGMNYTFSFTVFGPPELKFTLTSENLKSDFLIHGLVSGGVPQYQFHWSTGETFESILTKKGGLYTCAVIDNNGCKKEDNLRLSITEENENSVGVVLNNFDYQSPTIQISPEINLMHLFKMDGGLVKTNFSNNSTLDLTCLSSGQYFLVYEASDKISEKLIIIP